MAAVKRRRGDGDGEPAGLLARRVLPSQHRQGRKPTAQSQRTRERVIEAAAACIAEEGFAGAHTNRIAERAGISWGVLQYHFGDKAGLLSAILERGFEAMEADFEALEITGDTLRERIATVVNGGWAIFRKPLHRANSEILVNTRAGLADDPEREERLQGMTRDLYRLGRRALASAVGDSRRVRRLEGVLFATLRGFSLALMMQPRDYDFRVERAALVEMIAASIESADSIS